MGEGEVTDELLKLLQKGIVEFQEDLVREAAQEVVDRGLNACKAVMNGLASGLQEVGVLYAQKAYAIPEMLLCVDALCAGLDILRPHVELEDLCGLAGGQLILGMARDDVHDIGKSMVGLVFDAAGFTVHSLERETPIETFTREVIRSDCALVALWSAATAFAGVDAAIRMVKKKNPRSTILTGDAPGASDTADRSGRDIYGAFAGDAIQEAIMLIGRLRGMYAKGGLEDSSVNKGFGNEPGQEYATESVYVIVEPGICGFDCRIRTWKEGRNVRFDIESDCKQIRNLAEDLDPVNMRDIFAPQTKSGIYLSAERSRCHLACPVPTALVKGAEVALGLALPKEVTIRFLA